MSMERIEAERQAIQSLMDLYAHAKNCQRLYERAHMNLPEPLQRFLGMSEQGAKPGVPAQRRAIQIPPPEASKAPAEAAPGWISIDVASATATTVALALLRQANGPVRPRDLTERVTGILPNVLNGTIANIGTRLGGETIERSEDGWNLIRPEQAGVIYDRRVWGPPVIFAKQELAAHRRDAIIHVLRSFPTGLQTVQIVEQLQRCPWVHAPVNKDLVKADMEALSVSGMVRRRGNSKKWEIAPEESK